VLGAIFEFEKASLVAKMKAARDRKMAADEKCGDRRSYAELRPAHLGGLRGIRKFSVRTILALEATYLVMGTW
jgi:hypothetical protein